MPLSTYQELQTAVLGWLARPGDPLVAPAVPDMIRLFEAEASRRLRVGLGEKQVTLVTVPGTSRVALPSDFGALRQISCNGVPLVYRPPGSIAVTSDAPQGYSITGPATTGAGSGYRLARLDPTPNAIYEITILYLARVPPLSDLLPSNNLLADSPDVYLFGTLSEAELYIGHDERAPMWLERREAAFASIERADIKARWPGGGQLQIRVDGITTPHVGSSSGGGGTTSPVVTPLPLPDAGVVRVVNPISGGVVQMLAGERALYVEGTTRAVLTIALPPNPAPDTLVEISFEGPVDTLTMTDGGGFPLGGEPSSAYGPGAGLQFRYVGGEWKYWK